MDRLRTPVHGPITRTAHLFEVGERIFNAVWDSFALRTLTFALLGYAIGVALEDLTGPFVVTSGRQVLVSVSAPVTAAAWGALCGMSVRLFFHLVLFSAWELAAIAVVLCVGLATAFQSLVGRLVIAFSQLTF